MPANHKTMIVEQLLKIPIKEKKISFQRDRFSRSLLKSISWRIVGTLDTIIISYFITGQWDFALTIGAVEWVTKMILYVVHERLWDRIQWGKKES